MNSDRIREIQKETAYPDSVSVQQALLQVWNECEQHQNKIDRKASNHYPDMFSDILGVGNNSILNNINN